MGVQASLDMGINTYGDVFRPKPMDKDELKEHLETMSSELLEKMIQKNEKSIADFPERKRKVLEQLKIDMQRERAWLSVYKQELRRRQDEIKEA